MLLFGDATNPSNGFYEALGAERIHGPAGDGWRELGPLITQRCSGDHSR